MAKIERCDKNAYRIMEDVRIVAFALRFSNDKWGLFDINDTCLLPGKHFDEPKGVLIAWEALKGSE